jgi:3'(2'), 5'-bisphosphate nucleotidase
VRITLSQKEFGEGNVQRTEGGTGKIRGEDASGSMLMRVLIEAGIGQTDDGKDLITAARAALRGGQAALPFYGDATVDVRSKGAGGPVTEADHASNEAILKLLERERPEDPVLSEESPSPSPARPADRLWIVDPLDGTKEFLAGNGEFSVMVGLSRDGAAVLGAVFEPDIGRLYLGAIGLGAWRVDRPLDAPSIRPLDAARTAVDRLRFVRSRSHPSERLRRLEAQLGDFTPVVSGSVGVKCALITNGEADLYVHPVPYLKEWDTCAPEAVVRAAGGRVTDCAGGPLAYGKPQPVQPGGIFAATHDVWSLVAPIVLRETRDMFE